MKSRRGAYWPWLVSAALLFTVGVNVVMLFAANSDRNGSVVEPDYYRKAVAWDSTMARRAASDRLGWTAAATLERRMGDQADRSAIVVRISDAEGAPVSGATARAVLIHNLDAGHPQQVELREQGPGLYTGTARISHPGRWEVRVEARRDEARFASVLFAEAAAASGPR